LFFLGFPRDDVELFNLNKTKQQQQQEKVVEKKGQLKFFVVFVVVVVVLDTHTQHEREKKNFRF
jgi:hypothetical protein